MTQPTWLLDFGAQTKGATKFNLHNFFSQHKSSHCLRRIKQLSAQHKISSFSVSHFERYKNDDKVVKAERKGLIFISPINLGIHKHKAFIFLVLDKAQSGINETFFFGEKQKHSHKIEERLRGESEALSNKNNHG